MAMNDDGSREDFPGKHFSILTRLQLYLDLVKNADFDAVHSSRVESSNGLSGDAYCQVAHTWTRL